MRLGRGVLAVAAVSTALLAGCGSSVQPSGSETIGPLNPGLGVPGITITGTTPTTGLPGTTDPTDPTEPTDVAPTNGDGGGGSHLPTTDATQGGGTQSSPGGGDASVVPTTTTGPLLTAGFLTADQVGVYGYNDSDARRTVRIRTADGSLSSVHEVGPHEMFSWVAHLS